MLTSHQCRSISFLLSGENQYRADLHVASNDENERHTPVRTSIPSEPTTRRPCMKPPLHVITLLFISCSVLLSAADAAKPLKVFILAGQSNMDGQADIRTIDFLGEDKDPARAALLKVFKPDGKTLIKRADVWVANAGVHDQLQSGFGGRGNYDKLGTCIGPEYAFGYYVGEAFDEQVLLVKYAPGGQSLKIDFRPPSAGKLGTEMDDKEFDQATADKWWGGKKQKVVGAQYRKLIETVHETLDNLKKHFPAYDEKNGYEIAGFVWFQGYNDLGNRKDEYAKALACLIKDLRTEFKAPQMKAVIGVLGVNGVQNEVGKMKEIRDAQRTINELPEFKGNAKAIESAPLCHPDIIALQTAGWLNKDRDLKKNPLTEEEKAMLQRSTSNKGYHYYGEGRFFILLGKAFAETMLELLKK